MRTKKKEDRVEEREDSKSTAGVEVFDFIFSLRDVVQDASDEEAGEGEEQVYSHPAGISDETPETKGRVCSVVASGEVIKHNGEYGDSAETIKRSAVPTGGPSDSRCGSNRLLGGGELRDCHHRHSWTLLEEGNLSAVWSAVGALGAPTSRCSRAAWIIKGYCVDGD